ncbi:MAG: hypothetical protein II145_06515 [Selenomonas sp.]|nr:hypothetical protein [Selenomonas sp.]
MDEIKLENYQAEGVRFLLNHKKAALWFNMGTGKTLTTLVALGLMGIKCNILVIAPLAIARATWVDEIKKWNFNIPTTSLIVNERGNKYTRKKRHEIYETVNQTEPQIYFIRPGRR